MKMRKDDNGGNCCKNIRQNDEADEFEGEGSIMRDQEEVGG